MIKRIKIKNKFKPKKGIRIYIFSLFRITGSPNCRAIVSKETNPSEEHEKLGTISGNCRHARVRGPRCYSSDSRFSVVAETLTRCRRPHVRHHRSCLGSGAWVRSGKENRLEKRAAMHRLPLFSFIHSSGGCQNLRTASLDTGECHRLSGITTGSGVWPSAQNEAVGRGIVAGQHLTLPVGRVFLQNLQMTATEGKAKHGSTIQGIYAPTMSLIMIMTQRGMCLDSRTTNHAFPCMMAQGTKKMAMDMACRPNQILPRKDDASATRMLYGM
ncbi:hypothetical protein HYC85_029228 [Camellia sinensis]|uniref:Uncharacterized protein n=1 Tax=Camellia sinensis TaxID=4442 RepID=A0A7J7FY27_CAMSI|nr:hypothetical protein HYC85_029228 [Camellia sinensis]